MVYWIRNKVLFDLIQIKEFITNDLKCLLYCATFSALLCDVDNFNCYLPSLAVYMSVLSCVRRCSSCKILL